jgi:hypothetical protein
MLWLATAHPAKDNIYSIVVPTAGSAAPAGGQSGSGKGGGGRANPGNLALEAEWKKGPVMSGTLDGKTMEVHTYALVGGKATTAIYADEANTLLRADAVGLKVRYVRSGFQLTEKPELPSN